MKSGICLATILIFSASALAHPGKTDGRGGHKCWKNCDGWELAFSEYHLHDKDGNPIRLDAKGDPVKPVQPEFIHPPEPQKQIGSIEPVEQTQVTATTAGKNHETEKPDKKTIISHTYDITVHEESILPFNSIMLLALALLLLVVLIFVRRKREKN
ncbi:MAG: hypothetical protein M1508_05365 [Nitrospirae bacterium]|nr:hypothetical protein [Nitrospirota bacterium]MCL5421933.1 hypothetical protein [Nitrospirota bacterium]